MEKRIKTIYGTNIINIVLFIVGNILITIKMYEQVKQTTILTGFVGMFGLYIGILFIIPLMIEKNNTKNISLKKVRL